MSGPMPPAGRVSVVVLEAEMMIQQAAEFYRTVLPLADCDGMVHTSIMQILYALAQAAPDFAVSGASPEFCAAEVRLGLSLKKVQTALQLSPS